jgi:hypothetical protein
MNYKTATQVMEEQLVEKASRAISDEIDFEILSTILIKNCGWTRVVLDTTGPNWRAVDINEWLHAECTAHWKRNGRTFVFEQQDEAALFRLTWE